MDKKYYIFVNGEKFEVNKEIYDVYNKSKDKEKYFMTNLKKDKILIDTENEKIKVVKCKEISFDELLKNKTDIADDFNLEEFVLLSIMIKKLEKALNQLEDEEYKIIVELFFNLKSERKLAKELNFTRDRIKYLKNKILNKLKDILKNNEI